MRREALPVTFRQAEARRALAAIQAGDSCAVVGIGSVGKSNFLHFLGQEDVRRQYLGETWEEYVFIYLDVNKLLKKSLWGLWELLLHQLWLGLQARQAEALVLEEIDALHQRATQPQSRRLALRYVDRAIGLACGRLGLRLVLLVDEFDDLYRRLPRRGFSALRALRDEHKYRLMYLVATRKELARLRSPSPEAEAFEELLTPRTVWLGPYDEADGRSMLARLCGRYGLPPPAEAELQALLAETGGHPGLLSAAFQGWREAPGGWQDGLAADPRVAEECLRIFRSLPDDEQQALRLAARPQAGKSLEPAVSERLRRKGLLGGPWAAAGQVFCRLFAVFIARMEGGQGQDIYLDHDRRTLWIAERKIQGLAPLEYRLMTYLMSRRGQVVSRDEIAGELYPGESGAGGVADERIDAVIKRLRRQVEADPRQPRYLLTARGHGIQLAPPPEKE